ncbi:creatininase family protein [Halorubrum trueperi]|uniref:Creatininase family protein n=1 Tax=Halorubrum trueperi TaxID=2004704 RepID=A0ABD5UH09_9EURY
MAWKTAAEIRDVARTPGSVLVIPVGSIEQHGTHLPVATDTVLVSNVSTRAAERSDIPILCAPPVWSGYSPHHLPFGGTLTGEFDTLKSLLEEVATSGLENGFDGVVFVNGHGGNTALIDATVTTIGRRHPAVDVLGLTYFDLATDAVTEVRDSDVGGMGHGGEFETSLMLHLTPELVRTDALDGTDHDEPYSRGPKDLLDGGDVSVYRTFDEYSESGAIGDPTLATAEKGEILFDRIVAELADQFAEVHRQTEPAA